jgi:hypothetical protein
MPAQKTKDLTGQFTTNGENVGEIRKIPCAYIHYVSRINVEHWLEPCNSVEQDCKGTK